MPGVHVASRASSFGHSEETENTELRRGGKDKKKELVKRASMATDPAEKIWSYIPEIAEIAKKYNIFEDKVDFYEVVNANGQLPQIPHETRCQVDSHGIRDIEIRAHSAVVNISPHNHSKHVSIVGPSSINYFSLRLGNKTPSLDAHDEKSLRQNLSISPSCRLVEISRDSKICPNCGDALKPIMMNSEDRNCVKSALLNITLQKSESAGAKLLVLLLTTYAYSSCNNSLQ